MGFADHAGLIENGVFLTRSAVDRRGVFWAFLFQRYLAVSA